MRDHALRPQPPAPAPRPYTPEPRPQPRTPDTHPLSGLKHLGFITPQKPRPAVPTSREAEAAGDTLDPDVEQQLLHVSPGGNCLTNVAFPDAPLTAWRPDGSVGEHCTSPHVAEEVMVVVSGLRSGSCLVRFLCSNLCISRIDNYTRREVFGLLRVYFIYRFCIGFDLFIVLRDITHAAFLQLLTCKVSPCDVV